MSVESLTVAIDGEVSLENFSKAVEGFLGVVRALSSQAVLSESLDWVIDNLEYGSAIVSVRPRQSVATDVMAAIALQFLNLGHALNRGDESLTSAPLYRSGKNLLLAAPSGVRFETSQDEVVIGPNSGDRIVEARSQARHSFGTVRGTVQTLSRRKGVRFTLYDITFDKPVSCYLAIGQENMVKDYWGRRVSVSGRISRDSVTGVPLSIREIKTISIAEPSEPGSWRKAAGVLRGVFENAPESLIRELRDA